jgi:hypothetical protein
MMPLPRPRRLLMMCAPPEQHSLMLIYSRLYTCCNTTIGWQLAGQPARGAHAVWVNCSTVGCLSGGCFGVGWWWLGVDQNSWSDWISSQLYLSAAAHVAVPQGLIGAAATQRVSAVCMRICLCSCCCIALQPVHCWLLFGVALASAQSLCRPGLGMC